MSESMLKSIHRVALFIMLLVGWLTTSPVWAQAEAAVPADSKNYALAYGLTILCVVLGVMVVCRPFRTRAEKVERPAVDE